jgi:hypothetical protein
MRVEAGGEAAGNEAAGDEAAGDEAAGDDEETGAVPQAEATPATRMTAGRSFQNFMLGFRC